MGSSIAERCVPDQVLETETSVVIIGDVNPGAQVISKGNIVILGCCMGNIYAEHREMRAALLRRLR